jgi:hypothetical protein
MVMDPLVEIRRHTDVKSSLGILQDIDPSHRFGLVAGLEAEPMVRRSPDYEPEKAKVSPPGWLRGWDLNPRPSGYEPDVSPRHPKT